MSRILLLLDQKENRTLLAGELSQSHEVLVSHDDAALDQPFDLCMVDGRALDRLWERVQARKASEQPVFLPVLLVTSRPDVKMITRRLWQSVDELIIAPIEKPELRARVEVLLRSRGLSVSLRDRAEEAERAARLRDDVLAVVSHDLRNPLNVVLTSTSFLLEFGASQPPRASQQLELIRRSATQMNRLIQDLLEISVIEAGRLSVESRPEPVDALLEEACVMFAHAAGEGGVELACEPPGAAVHVRADRQRVNQVLGNLIGNALKFTPRGGRIVIRAQREGDFVRFAVSDTGAGIGADELPHVFERFWQARQSRQGGAGLGLAISRGIVEAHGGRIHAESTVGVGSTFGFTLPVAEGGAPDDAPPGRG